MPRWVVVSLIVLALVAGIFIVTRLAGVDHGPGLHRPGGGTTPVEQPPGGHTPPVQHSP